MKLTKKATTALSVSMFLTTVLCAGFAVHQAPEVKKIVALEDAWLVHVVDEKGHPVEGASIALRGSDDEFAAEGVGQVVTDRFGYATFTVDGPALVAVSAKDRVSRVRAVQPGTVDQVTLFPRHGTVSLRFAGDTMFGRRFSDITDQKSATSEPSQIENDASNQPTSDQVDVLGGVRPLLQDADITAVNLETVLVTQDDEAPAGPNTQSPKPENRSFSSPVSMAKELARNGIDVVSLANDHSFDSLDAGLSSTTKALEEAGIVWFGAGHSENEAWRPAVIKRDGVNVAFVGCTTIAGDDQAVSNVATRKKGGAAQCTRNKLRAAIRAASKQADSVVVMIHGGKDDQRAPTPYVEKLLHTAQEAGARVVVNSNPHVIGSVRHIGDSVIADSLGNLAFDQEGWQNVPGYIMRTDIRDKKVVQADVDPIILDHYMPRPVVGDLAQHIGRIASSGSHQALPLSSLAASSTFATIEDKKASLNPDQVRTISPGWVAKQQDSVQFGTDLLLSTGQFESLYADPDTSALEAASEQSPQETAMWKLGSYVSIKQTAQCGSGGSNGLSLVRSPKSVEAVDANTLSRVPVVPGTSLSFVADVRSASRNAELVLRWYQGNPGDSVTTSTMPIDSIRETGPDNCRQVRFDITVPDGMTQVVPAVRLKPEPDDVHFSAHIDIDNLRLIAWKDDGIPDVRSDTVSATKSVELTLSGNGPSVIKLKARTPLNPPSGTP